MKFLNDHQNIQSLGQSISVCLFDYLLSTFYGVISEMMKKMNVIVLKRINYTAVYIKLMLPPDHCTSHLILT